MWSAAANCHNLYDMQKMINKHPLLLQQLFSL